MLFLRLSWMVAQAGIGMSCTVFMNSQITILQHASHLIRL